MIAGISARRQFSPPTGQAADEHPEAHHLPRRDAIPKWTTGAPAQVAAMNRTFSEGLYDYLKTITRNIVVNGSHDGSCPRSLLHYGAAIPNRS